MVASCGGINIGLWSDSVIVQWVSQDMEDFDGGVTERQEDWERQRDMQTCF